MRKKVGYVKTIMSTVSLVHANNNCSYYIHMDIDCVTIYSHIPIRMSQGGKENEDTRR
jgi:hypothetical protein